MFNNFQKTFFKNIPELYVVPGFAQISKNEEIFEDLEKIL